MKDVNYPLRKIYYAALSPLTYNGIPIPVFFQKAPDDIIAPNYVVFDGITNSDTSGKYKAQTDTAITVTIHTFKEKYNDGRAADDIAGLILNAIHPNKQTRPDMSADGLQVVNTKLTTDFTQNYNINNTREYVDRLLTFTHSIFQLS